MDSITIINPTLITFPRVMREERKSGRKRGNMSFGIFTGGSNIVTSPGETSKQGAKRFVCRRVASSIQSNTGSSPPPSGVARQFIYGNRRH